jgi:hypothetical protein
MEPTKKASVASAFLDAFADIIADRVAMKLGDTRRRGREVAGPERID